MQFSRMIHKINYKVKLMILKIALCLYKEIVTEILRNY